MKANLSVRQNKEKYLEDRQRKIEEKDRYLYREEQKRLRFIRKEFEDALRKTTRRIIEVEK